jgi:hypothetical protein
VCPPIEGYGLYRSAGEVQAEIMAEAFVFNMEGLPRFIGYALVTKDYLDARLDARFAEQNARIDSKFSEQDARIDGKFAHIDVQFAEIKGQFRLVYWMLAVVIASTVIPQVNALLSN